MGYTDSLPAGLTDVFGVTVEEVEPVYEDNHTALKTGGIHHEPVMDNLWCELLEGSARALGSYIEDYKEGKMVISKNQYGKGRAYYMGTDLDDMALADLLVKILRTAGIPSLPFTLPEKIQVFSRSLNNQEYYFLFNFAAKEVVLPLQESMKDYLTGEDYQSTLTMKRNGFYILTKVNTDL